MYNIYELNANEHQIQDSHYILVVKFKDFSRIFKDPEVAFSSINSRRKFTIEIYLCYQLRYQTHWNCLHIHNKLTNEINDTESVCVQSPVVPITGLVV